MSSSPLKFKTQTELFKFIDENNIEFVDLNFTDLRGQWQHTALHASAFDNNTAENGVYFDGSSIAGWKSIDESDMLLVPDIRKACLDPFTAQATLKVFCDVKDPKTNAPYSRDPRLIARAAEHYMRETGMADAAYFGPEAEFFIFEDVKIDTAPHRTGFQIDSEEGDYNSGRAYDTGNMGHRPGIKGGYLPESPLDSLSDMRAEMVSVMRSMGLSLEKHHHEVAPGQCEIGVTYSTLLDSADNMQIYKYAVRNVANSYGKTATFMPKPVAGDNGSGMHCHQSLWKAGKPLFAGDVYAGLSENALYYIGGIIKHAKALNAFTNPATNSYRRLVPGYEAPVLLAYSEGNRSAACRIPRAPTPAGKRVEIRFPDPSANPYLAFAAMLMAGLDGLENKIHPGNAIDKNLYALPEKDVAAIPSLSSSLQEALEALRADQDFLKKGSVFTQDVIDAYIALKEEEIDRYKNVIHPVEYKMYYSS